MPCGSLKPLDDWVRYDRLMIDGQFAQKLGGKVSGESLKKLEIADSIVLGSMTQLSLDEPSLYKYLTDDENLGLLYRATVSAISQVVNNPEQLQEIAGVIARLTLAVAMAAVNNDRSRRS